MVILGFIEFLKNKLFSSNEVTPIQESQDIRESQENGESQNSIQNIQDQNIIRSPNNSIIDVSPHIKFYVDNSKYINPLKQKIIDFSMKANGKIVDIDTTISDCKKTLELLDELKKYCYKTQDGIAYFEDFCGYNYTEHLSFIQITEKRLQDLTENYDERKRYYQRRQYAMNHLKTDLITLISNQENILQKDVYSHFDADLKDNVARMLYDMDKKGEIKRVKHGSTYQLSIK